MSEIARRLGKPATSLLRPLARLVDLDVVAESRDGKAVLIGEAKWNAAELRASQAKDRLLSAAKNLPVRKIVPALWAQRGRKSPDIHILGRRKPSY